jgi:hypothetical protein
MTREQFEDWCYEIMQVHCLNCTGHHEGCELHQLFDDNFIPESSWNLDNCRYAYKTSECKPDPEKIKKFQEFKEKMKAI